ncbi:MAG: 50S ribosomal protein L27 [Candidatus Niyogibacteria bacterium]|nr:50S ribosomal protein L27 [Candidatus Niyogibacteria bacterium]
MAHKKSGGSAKNLRDSQPKYLGIKLSDGQKARRGSIIVRQRGTRILAGRNTRLSRDHTIHASADGVIKFRKISKTKFDGSKRKTKIVDVIIGSVKS